MPPGSLPTTAPDPLEAVAPTLDGGGARDFVTVAGEPGAIAARPEAYGVVTELAQLSVTGEHAGRYLAPPGGELGRGGIGRVYIAVDRHLGRDVAIKELLTAEDTAGGSTALPALVRFLREARITGSLEHPNIVPVHELGRRADGTLYYTMRVVRGRTLSRALSESNTLADRLRLLDHFIGLCQAIAYAHSRGVVHRDIKPDNVMIGEFGETVVLDWGMAKERSGAIADAEPSPSMAAFDGRAVDLTMDGAVFGTPSYMSPEQARGAVQETDERSDVWALGVVLYAILTGRLPFDGKNLLELIGKIREGSHAAPRTLDAQIPPELEAITERALRAKPSERYPTAKELLRDVDAYRSGARVGAYEYSSLDLLRRFIDRHRAAVIASGVGLLVALALAALSYVRLAAARDTALQAKRRATLNEQEARKSERAAKESLSLVLVEKAEQAMNESDRSSAETLALEALRLGERSDARGIVLAAESGFRPEPRLSVTGAAGCLRYALALSTNVLACARNDGISLYGVRDGALRGQPIPLGAPSALALSADGAFLAAAHDEAVVLFRIGASGATPVLERHATSVATLAVSASGTYVVEGGPEGTAVVWDVGAPNHERRLAVPRGVSALAFSPDESSVVVGGELGQVTLWDLRHDRARTLVGHTGTVRAFAFAQQGRYLASAGADRSIRFWDVRDGTPVSSPIVHVDAITSLGWTADGRVLAFGSRDRTLHVVDLKNAERRAEVRYHEDSVDWVGLSADGKELVSVSRDVGAETWSLASSSAPSTLIERGNVLSFAFVPGGEKLVSAGVGSEGVAIFDVRQGTCETRLPAGIDRVRTLAISADGQRLAFAGSAARVMLWDLAARVPLHVFDGPRDEVRAVAFSADGRWLASAGLDGMIRVVDARTSAKVADLDAGAPVQSLAFVTSPVALVTGDRDGMLTMWDVATKRKVLRFKAHDDWLLALAPSPDGKRIATAGGDRRVRVWDARTAEMLSDLSGHDGRVLAVAFAPDGRLLASGAEDKSVRLWNADTGHEAALLLGHTGAVRAVHFAPSEPLLASAGDDGTIRMFHLDALTEPAAAVSKRVRARYRVELIGTKVARARLP